MYDLGVGSLQVNGTAIAVLLAVASTVNSMQYGATFRCSRSQTMGTSIGTVLGDRRLHVSGGALESKSK